jgi:glycosyltransferase involved in cell wall biosynthesis
VSAERPLTVLHLVANRWWTGSAEPVIRLLTGLRARGHRVLLGLITGDRFEQKAREAGLEPLPGLSLEVRGNPVHAVGDLRRVRQAVRAEGVDVVHVHHSHDHWLGWLGRGPAGLVRTFHNARAVRLTGLSPWLYRRTDALIAVSREIEERGRRAGIPPERLVRVDGVVDVGRFEDGDGAAIRKEFDLGNAPVVGCVSRLAPRRGHELLIRAFQQLLPEYPHARLLLVGKGEARARLEMLVSDLGLAREVLFAGYRDADLPAVLQALDAFALMGAGSDESCRAALEAMAAGRPVVGRRVGALPETVVHGVTGLLVDDDRPESVAAALRVLVARPEQAAAMGRAGRERARTLFGSDAHAAQ